MLICLVTAKGAPGASTTALALTTAWPAHVLLAECDPAGGDLRSGLLTGIGQGRTIANLAMAAQRDGMISGQDLAGQLYTLQEEFAEHTRFALPGLADPMTASALGGLWEPLAAVFTEGRIGPRGRVDVVADCGRLDHPYSPWPLLRAADLVLVTVRATMSSVMAATARVPHLRRSLSANGQGPEVAAALVADGPYSTAEVADALGAPVALRLPADSTAVADLVGGKRTKRLSRSEFMRSAATGAARIHRSRGPRPPQQPGSPVGSPHVV